MKIFALYTCIAVICGVIVYTAYKNPARDLKAFMPGVYARQYADEFGQRYDTIVIRPNGLCYEVTRRSRLFRTTEDSTRQPQYQLFHGTAIFDEQNQWLWLREAGKAIQFNIGRKELRIGQQPYTKL